MTKKQHSGRSHQTLYRLGLIPAGLIMLGIGLCAAGCLSSNQPSPTAWNTLTAMNAVYPGKTGCWEGYNENGDPGTYFEFAAHGLRVDYVHPEYFTRINDDGTLSKPGYQDPGRQGQASIDYPDLLYACNAFHQHGVGICVGLFVHNFETVSAAALTAFFRRWSLDLKGLGIDSVIFIPAWEIQGQWAAWSQGATRDCYIDPAVFNSQMIVFRNAVDKAMADAPTGAEIILGAVANGWTANTSFNSFSHSALEYMPGLRLADWVGLDYYPVKAGTPGGPADALNDAAGFYRKLGTHPDFGLAEYSINTVPAMGGPVDWSEAEKIDFIKTTYDLLRTTYPMIGHIHWWFIGRGPTNAWICFK